jgi:Phage integrase family.
MNTKKGKDMKAQPRYQAADPIYDETIVEEVLKIGIIDDVDLMEGDALKEARQEILTGVYIAIGLYTGLRVVEILPRKWGDFFDENKEPLEENIFNMCRKQKKPRHIVFSEEFRERIKWLYDDLGQPPLRNYIFRRSKGYRDNVKKKVKRPYLSSQMMRIKVKEATAHLD